MLKSKENDKPTPATSLDPVSIYFSLYTETEVLRDYLRTLNSIITLEITFTVNEPFNSCVIHYFLDKRKTP